MSKSSGFQKYSICCVFRHFVCVFVFVVVFVIVFVFVFVFVSSYDPKGWTEWKPTTTVCMGWEEVARVGGGEEGGLVGSAELGDPNLAGGPVLPMKLWVCWSGICLLSLCNSFYRLCCSLWPPKVVPSRPAAGLARGGTSNMQQMLICIWSSRRFEETCEN